ncbi:hypothetical protein ACHAWO_008361 [Cyclotella atomus]|uniref:LNR domain-containing protein n=1 Tax=Cyclotella atomus TaxID=382360 RepID=A0ABD3N604_9STRA
MKQTPIILAAAASAYASPTIRGRNARRPTKYSNARNRPAIKDERQREKIRLWNESRRLQQQEHIDAHDKVHLGKKSRQLQDSMLAYHTKSFSDHYSGTANLHVKVEQGEDLGFQTKDDLPSSSSSSSSTTTTTSTTSTSEQPQPQSAASYQYYPSFDMNLYPDGACLNDGKNPASYALTPGEFLFDDHEECCTEWFIDVALCLEATGGTTAGVVPTSFPTWNLENNGGSPWPTWSDDVFNYDEEEMGTSSSVASQATDTTTTSAATTSIQTTTFTEYAAADDVFNYNPQGQNIQAQGSHAQGSQDQGNQASQETHEYTFFESFENGDFSSHPWELTTSSSSGNNALSVDPWAADRTALAYEGNYAARPGILSEAGTVTNLTIALNDLDDNGSPDGIFQGGLLSFAIHAAVDMPVDALYFSINNHIIRSFETPTGYSPGDWEEVSTLLLPGEHTLSWSYQFFGMPEDQSQIDPRREGNSWLDGISLIPYTGDYAMSEGEINKFDMSNGVAPWTVVQDPNAFDGDKSLIAYTQDIVSNQGSIEMSWTIVVSPDGGTVSFAAFASIYAPHDILEFRIDNDPKVAITTPSFSWQEFEVEVDPGKHVCTWRLVKNVPGLDQYVIEDVDVPEGYQGYVKVDGIKYEDNMKDDITTTEPPTEPTTTTTSIVTTTQEPTTTSVTSTSEAASTTAAETTQAQTTTVSETTTTSETEASSTNAPEEETTSTAATESDSSSSSAATSTEATQESGTSSTTEAGSSTTESASSGTSSTASASTIESASSTTGSASPSDGCPDGTQEVEGLPGCCVEEANYLGDGACDPWEPYNTEACGFDLGDCCHDTCNEDSPYGCHTKEGADYGPFGFFCIDQRSSSIVMDVEKCQVENREWIGDGGCDADSEYNTPECGYDGGDCCESTCDQDYAFYTCGANQPYECLSEDR